MAINPTNRIETDASLLHDEGIPGFFDAIQRVDACSAAPTEAQWEELAAKEGVSNLIRKYGAPRVLRWVRNLAAMQGQDC